MTYSSLLEAYGWERSPRMLQARRDEHDIADLPRVNGLRRAAFSSSRRLRLTSGSRSRRRDGRLALPRHARGTTGARATLACARRLAERAAGRERAALCRLGISTPEHARAAAELADGIVVGSRAVQVAEDGPDALREYVASLRGAI